MRWDPSCCCCCCSTWEPLPRECSITSVQKTASWGIKTGENLPGCHHSTDWCKETLVWGAEHQSCPGATGELCYTQSQPCPIEHQEPSTLMPHKPLASSRCIPAVQTALDGCPCCRRALCVQLSDPSGSISDRSRSQAGLGDAPGCSQASPAQHLPPLRACAGCLPSPQLCWVYPKHSMTEILPKAAPLAAQSPSQGFSLWPHPITALSWAGPVSLGLCCSL